jgi:hypothetical protein
MLLLAIGVIPLVGAFISGAHGFPATTDIYFDTGTAGCNGDFSHSYEMVCLPKPFKRYMDGLAKCPSGKEITTAAECREAGLSVGGALRDGSNVVVGDWGHTPCGCFISGAHGFPTTDIYFDTGTAGCNAVVISTS